ncbi:MAG TPA: HAMP domain-containing sensor histidine kinase [Candidatus Omnitrophota bacterium]|jgi:signal transduction histidine kinase|nr:HAMP domain-containing sensor histidine kinase [Candidatus Omnitrophota bacterium]HQB93671.1 HAMP domain-containing sensor histidine kinase [Candidatus Omnitrophota bacterium]
MSHSGNPDKATHEIGRIYDAITDKSILIDFFLQTLLQLVPSSRGYLFLAGPDKQLWLESATFTPKEASAVLLGAAQAAFDDGKPSAEKGLLFLPLIAGNASVGLACLERAAAFTSRETETGFNLASEFSGALKNILLFEENLKMERLAAIGQTTAMLVHEIKNILQLAKFSDEMIRMGVNEKNPKFIATGLGKLEKTLKDMDGFIWEVAGLSKDYQLEPEDVDVPALLQELGEDLAERAGALSVKLDCAAEKDFPVVRGDGRSLYRALLNLVKNAFEAFKDKPDAWIRVRARVTGPETYEITVEDNGCGMPEEVRARLFEAFFSTKGKRGTGLGLMVVSRTVKMHGGVVTVESRPGIGTKFTLVLPRFFSR